MAKPDIYADIDFDEINEATNLAADEIKCLKVGYLNTLISPIKTSLTLGLLRFVRH